MSTVIGVCGINFCLFAADTRMVTEQNGSLVFHNDDTKKIFKINQNVLFGATGLFHANETIIKPLEFFPNPNVVTVSNAQAATLDYMRQHLSTLSVRNYLIGGKNDSGEFSLTYLHYNKATHNIDVQVFKPVPPHSFAIICALPASLEPDAQRYQDLVGQLVNQCTSINDLVEGLAKIIRDIADKDASVGKKVLALLVT